MKQINAIVLFLAISLTACGQISQYINKQGKTIAQRVTLPSGYSRMSTAAGSFGEYVQQLPLLPDGAVVHYYDGRTKPAGGIYVAVVDLPIGNKNLQQCADVIMHVRADYLYRHNMKDKIKFTFTNGFTAYYSKWTEGYRITINGNKATWVKSKPAGDNAAIFAGYMDMVYNYCGTLSMSRELKKITLADIRPGDVLIKGGSPGHAELIVDVAQDKQGHKLFLLTQSYMPAQQMQLLANPGNPALSPWYEASGAVIKTPEWDFTSDQVMRFND